MSKDILQTPDLNFPEADLSPPAFRILLCTVWTVSMCDLPFLKKQTVFLRYSMRSADMAFSNNM